RPGYSVVRAREGLLRAVAVALVLFRLPDPVRDPARPARFLARGRAGTGGSDEGAGSDAPCARPGLHGPAGRTSAAPGPVGRGRGPVPGGSDARAFDPRDGKHESGPG